MLARIRKAIVAGAGAGASAALTALVAVWPDGVTADEAGTVAGAFAAAALAVGLATWRVPNTPSRGA